MVTGVGRAFVLAVLEILGPARDGRRLPANAHRPSAKMTATAVNVGIGVYTVPRPPSSARAANPEILAATDTAHPYDLTSIITGI
jgi:hypothetical protein